MQSLWAKHLLSLEEKLERCLTRLEDISNAVDSTRHCVDALSSTLAAEGLCGMEEYNEDDSSEDDMDIGNDTQPLGDDLGLSTSVKRAKVSPPQLPN